MVIVKLKDPGIIQRFRIHSSLWAKERVTAAIRSNEGTKFIKVVAAHQLKSGDIQAFTSTAAEVNLLQKEQVASSLQRISSCEMLPFGTDWPEKKEYSASRWKLAD